MNFQNLQYFLIVTEEMNVTRAAKRLHISEQALSRQIGKLEKELGAKLFERYPRFTLSPAGKWHLSLCERAPAAYVSGANFLS